MLSYVLASAMHGFVFCFIPWTLASLSTYVIVKIA